jgi:hypothetical protein
LFVGRHLGNGLSTGNPKCDFISTYESMILAKIPARGGRAVGPEQNYLADIIDGALIWLQLMECGLTLQLGRIREATLNEQIG